MSSLWFYYSNNVVIKMMVKTTISEVDGQTVAFFGVFDGHGGSRTRKCLKDNLFMNVSGHPGFMKDKKTTIAIQLSIDHKLDIIDECECIEQAGGFIIWAGTWRVGGVLAVSHAFGDKLLKPYVVVEPEIQEELIDGLEFIIVASDGLWNVLSNKQEWFY